MARLLDEYAAVAGWDVSTRQTNQGFIRRTIKPALGHMQVRKVRGPILDKLYTRLKRCGDLSCTGRPFTEHRNVPALTINREDSRPLVRVHPHRRDRRQLRRGDGRDRHRPAPVS